MIKLRLFTTLLAVAALGGCATYDYVGGNAPGGYYSGRTGTAGYGPYYDGYGYPGQMVYGGYGYRSYYNPYYYGQYSPYYYGPGRYPYYPHRPNRPHPPRPDHAGPDRPRPDRGDDRAPPWRHPGGRAGLVRPDAGGNAERVTPQRNQPRPERVERSPQAERPASPRPSQNRDRIRTQEP